MKCIFKYRVCHLTQRHKTLTDEIEVEGRKQILMLSEIEEIGYEITLFTTDEGFRILRAAFGDVGHEDVVKLVSDDDDLDSAMFDLMAEILLKNEVDRGAIEAVETFGDHVTGSPDDPERRLEAEILKGDSPAS